jgi:hypothetical protein
MGQQTRLVLQYSVRRRDVFICQPCAYPRPCDQELAFAVVEVFAVSAVLFQRWTIVHVAAPPPLRSADFHDPAYRHAAPEHGEVIRARPPADHGDAQSDGSIAGHRTDLDPDVVLSLSNLPVILLTKWSPPQLGQSTTSYASGLSAGVLSGNQT